MANLMKIPTLAVSKGGIFQGLYWKLIHISLLIADKKEYNEALAELNKLMDEVKWFRDNRFSISKQNGPQNAENIDINQI